MQQHLALAKLKRIMKKYLLSRKVFGLVSGWPFTALFKLILDITEVFLSCLYQMAGNNTSGLNRSFNTQHRGIVFPFFASVIINMSNDPPGSSHKKSY